jgi:hypothetical protein
MAFVTVAGVTWRRSAICDNESGPQSAFQASHARTS